MLLCGDLLCKVYYKHNMGELASSSAQPIVSLPPHALISTPSILVLQKIVSPTPSSSGVKVKPIPQGRPPYQSWTTWPPMVPYILMFVHDKNKGKAFSFPQCLFFPPFELPIFGNIPHPN